MNINYYNPYVREELMLYHHGVLGQRWGRKNGPPYPLDAGDHSASEKRAGWRKSLAGGIKTFGRGSLKAAKAIGRGSVKAAKAIGRGTNTALVRTNLKPKVLMSEAEMDSQIQRLRKKTQLKNAMKGRFGDVTQYEKKKGEDFISRMMKSIGDDVLIPTATGLITYKLANTMAKATGDKAPSMVETVFGKRVGFRDNERYISNKVLGKLYNDPEGPHLIEDTRKGNKNGGNKKEDDKNKDGNDGGNKQKQDGNQQKQDGNGGGNQPKKKKQKPQENRNDQKDQDKSSEAKAESSKEEKKDTPKPADSDKTPESNSSPSPSKNSLTDRTRSLNARVGELNKKYDGGYSTKKIQAQIRKENEGSGKEDYSSIWKSTPPSVRKKLNSSNVNNTLSQKMSYFNRLTNGGVSRAIPGYSNSADYKRAYENRLGGKPVGDMTMGEYADWLKRIDRL